MILSAVVIAIVVGGAAALILDRTQRPAYDAYSTTGARVGDPGHNLVGPNWSGNARPGNG
jgi:hypothetical protein